MLAVDSEGESVDPFLGLEACRDTKEVIGHSQTFLDLYVAVSRA